MSEVRRLSQSHVDLIEQIERRAYPTPWSRSMFAGELSKATSRCYGMFDGALLQGYLVVASYVDAWHVMNLAVDPGFRRRGIGRRLLEHFFTDTADDPARGYTLEVRVSNGGAVRLYEELGFVPAGVRRGYYTDNREDALIMWRDAPGAVLRADG